MEKKQGENVNSLKMKAAEEAKSLEMAKSNNTNRVYYQ
jgi:hypothetical protein